MARHVFPWFLSGREQPAVYCCLATNEDSGKDIQYEGWMLHVAICELHEVIDERDNPHRHVYKWVDEKEAELAVNLVPGSQHFRNCKVLTLGIDEM